MRRVVATALAVIVMAGLVPVLTPPAGADEAPPQLTCPAPLPGPRAVVQLAYMVLLRRCPDAAGAVSWEASLRDGMATETFARRIASTPEARGVVVADAYQRVLARPATAAERAFWAGWLRPDPTRIRRHDDLLAELLASEELYAAAGRDDGIFTVTLFERILERRAQPSDIAYWEQRLAGGNRRGVARTLVRLPEPLAKEVTKAWGEVLGALPTIPQRTWEAARLRNDGDRLGLSARLVGSAAFDERAQARALVVPGRYVALGDSFALGEGYPPYVTEGDDTGCGYTTSAYPEVARTSSELVPGTLDVAACTGSSLLSLYPYVEAEEDVTYPGQIDAIADGESPALVTLSIGGEDIGMVGLIQSCLQIQVDGAGQFSPYYSREECDQQLDTFAPEAIEALRTGLDDESGPDGGGYQCTEPCSLTSTVTDVMAAAPDAEVVVVGLPPIMADVAGGCRGDVMVEGRPSPSLDWYAAPRDVRRGQNVIASLNAALREAAVAAGATFVDVSPSFLGHEACSADPWIAGTHLDEHLFPQYTSYHPNRRGGVAIAAALIDALEG